MKKKFILVATIALTGCSVAPSIQRASDSKSAFEGAVYTGEKSVVGKSTLGVEEYRVFHQAGTGFTPISSVREYAEERANTFCARQGKAMNTISEQATTPPYVLGNFPKVEIIFSCVEKPKTSTLTPSATGDDQYTRLRKLKDLLDDRVITQDEFETEKKKILSR